jgi:ABC-2 type transport system permease protein
MNPRITGAIFVRILRQLRRDPRTVAMMLVLPCVLLTLLYWMFADQPAVFDRIGGALIVIFPFIVMFLVTSVTTLTERTSGTLERLFVLPMGKLDFLVGYGLAFGVVAVAQALLVSGLAVGLLGLDIAGSVLALVLVAVVSAVLGTALGLFVSAFARTEFQAVQFMPLIVIPQILLCGLFIPRSAMPNGLQPISDALPLSYSVDAVRAVGNGPAWTGDLTIDVLVVVAFIVGALALGAATLRRRTA